MVRRLATLLATLVLGALPLHARGGGGCLERGTLVATPGGDVRVEALHVGDTVWGVVDGRRAPATVAALYAVEPESYVELVAGDATLRVTPDHPVQTAPGIFVRAARLAVGATLFTADGPVPLRATRMVSAAAPAYNLLVSPGGVFFANGVAVHNKGCFLPDTPITLADGSRRAISAVRPGDRVLAFEPEGAIVPAVVRDVLTHAVKSYLVLRTASVELRVTEEHPFYVGAGTFKTAAALRLGDAVYVYDGRALVAQPILALERVQADVTVYNLQTDAPHTFLANGVAVHNKGGGCFAAGTLVATPDGARAIETLRLGDVVVARGPEGSRTAAAIAGVYLNFSPLLTLRTDRGLLRTTAEHPLLGADGEFHAATDFAVGDGLARVDGVARLLGVERGTEDVPVYTLSVDAPHTFFADGFIAHNKGGGGFGGGYHGGGYHSGGSGGTTGNFFPFFLLIIFIFVVLVQHLGNKSETDDDEELDYCFSRKEIDAKAVKTLELLRFISRTDPAWAPDTLRARAREVFVELQGCWIERDYAPMEPLMMRDLYEEHCAQLRGLRQTHEINRIDQLTVESVDVVQVNYAEKKNDRVFAALITASARDYYVDDRSQAFLRGDSQPQRFQEFWTFQLCDGAWKLREIEQSKESDLLTTENFFAPFTDTGRDQIYGAAAGAAGPAGPALPADVQTKAQKIDRLLNFLVQTDRLWNRDAMLATARRVFTNLQLAWQDGRPEMLTGIALDDAFAAELRAGLEANQRHQLKVELRNFCVRKIEIVLVNNRDDRRQDEFTARITAHAQMILSRAGQEVRHDEWVKPWTEFWTFGRDAAGTGWALRAIQPAANGDSIVARENTDEGSSVEMLQWYYSKTRAS